MARTVEKEVNPVAQALNAEKAETEGDGRIFQRVNAKSKRPPTSRKTTNLLSLTSTNRYALLQDKGVKTLHFCAWTQKNNVGEFGFDWYVLDVETRKISPTLRRMPPCARDCATGISWCNYLLVFGGACYWDPSCPEGKKIGAHLHKFAFLFDFVHPEKGWMEVSSILVGRMKPSAVAIQGKVYVFGGCRTGHYAEVFDVSQNIWNPLTSLPASDVNPFSVSYPVLLDSFHSRVLVHFACNSSLYAYKVDDESWELLDEKFDEWSSQSVVVDGVLYCLFSAVGDLYFPSVLKAYDLVGKKWLTVNWLSEFDVYVPGCADLLHLGNGKLCFAWYALPEIQYFIISVEKNSEEIFAIAETESVICVEFEKLHVRVHSCK